MVGATGTTRAPRRRWWQGRPDRVARATTAWAVVYAGFGLSCALSGTPLLYLGSRSGPPALAWGAAGLGALTALVCGAVARYGPLPALRVLLWVCCVPAGLAAFGLLMDLITLVFGQGVDSGVAAANHALAGAGAVLLAATARSVHHSPTAVAVRAPSAAPRPVQLAASAGTAAFLPYAAMKLVWAYGGTFAGMSGEEMLAISKRNGASGAWLALESWGLDGTVLLAALGVFLLWGLVRPWGQVFPRWTLLLRGRRVPRWLPLGPALVGAATLAPYGLFGVGYAALATSGAVTMRRGDFHSSGDALLVAWIGLGAFAVYGGALTVAARSYWHRTHAARAGTE
ncbi:hypothetical protein ACIQOF_25655 [Streptomyces sp. NPDC091265]|uniref:hypothetical protein n=1 Tax=unclassified Streptomyces TaxID=2593676 RepID=UPI00345068DE